jgi:hypothetical protein
VSAFDLPVLRGLHTGRGFWVLAFDAQTYFEAAAAAARDGLNTISDISASPFYVRALAVWLDVFGVSVPTAILFNVSCYFAGVLLIVALSPSTRATTVVVLALTVSPALLLFTTQPLKDPFLILLLVLVLYAMKGWNDAFHQRGRRRVAMAAASLFAVFLGISGVSGIRPWVAALIVVAILAGEATSLSFSPGVVRRWQRAAAAVVLLVIVWAAFKGGSSVYYGYYEALVIRAMGHPSVPLQDLERVRDGFSRSGGGTSLADATAPVTEKAFPASADTPAPVTDKASPAPSPSVRSRAAKLALGCSALFVPMSLLKAAGVVSFAGGRGLIPVTDVDTIVSDAALVACLVLVVSLRPSRRALPMGVLVIVFAALMTVVLAYGVTNFGTLFRFRPMVMTPLWLLPALVQTSCGTRRLHQRLRVEACLADSRI